MPSSGEAHTRAGSTAPIRCGLNELISFASDLLLAVGMDTTDARGVASALARADARGVQSHGMARLPIYLDRLRDGGNSPTARPTVEREHGATAVVNGRNALGLVAARFGMRQALRLAHEHSVAAVACRRSGHFGPAADFALMGPPEGCVAIAMTNVNVAMAPWGGVTPLLGNNPIAIAAPARDHPFVLDMAMSTVARGKIRLAAASGAPIPEGWALDADGRPTVDARAALNGLITPMAGPKGSGLAIAVDILCSLLSGSAFGAHVQPQRPTEVHQDVGHFFVAIAIDRFVDREIFTARIDEMLGDIRRSDPAAGVDSVLAPGDIEHAQYEEALRNGVVVDRTTWAALAARAGDLHVRLPNVANSVEEGRSSA